MSAEGSSSAAEPSPAPPSDAVARAVAAFDHLNRQDPNLLEGEPAEWLYAQRLTRWMERLEPEPSPALRLAARCQHLERWTIPRNTYPEGRAGYLEWRTVLKQFHARRSAEVLREHGVDPAVIARVAELNLKKHFPRDPEVRVLEDALCLVFLEFQFADLASRTPDEKMIEILRKTWAKMTERARAFALQLPLSPACRALVERAIAGRTPVSETGP